VQVLDLVSGELLQLRDRSDADHLLEVLGHPHRDRSSPVSVPGVDFIIRDQCLKSYEIFPQK
jgi:hypothetical protein